MRYEWLKIRANSNTRLDHLISKDTPLKSVKCPVCRRKVFPISAAPEKPEAVIARPSESIKMSARGSQKLAILRIKFSDVSIEPENNAYFRDLFINRGTEGLNDYYIMASLGTINLDGSVLFPWKSCGLSRADFVATYADRRSKIDLACSTHGVKRNQYAGVVAIYNGDTVDDGMDGNGGVLAWTTPGDMQLAFFAHELGHVFGVMDSFDESDRLLADDHTYGWYWDQYDIMSARNVFSHSHARWRVTGPLMCTANQDYLNWIPSDRIWSPVRGASHAETIDLVALSHAEDRGFICAKFDEWYVEFRMNDGLDAGLARPCVLIHSMSPTANAILHNHSHIAGIWDNEWQPGNSFGPPALTLNITGGVRVDVLSFDLKRHVARLRIRAVTARPPVLGGVGPGRVLGGVGVDGGGWVILPNGTVIRIPPRSPILGMLSHIALVSQAEERMTGRTKSVITGEMYREIQGMALRAIKASQEGVEMEKEASEKC